ncbi:MAG: InlB B-repeat-containing protein, partial [Clostridia bacterium]|nr:InlB B-repeat-containing protein [Clostridia bacterium]
MSKKTRTFKVMVWILTLAIFMTVISGFSATAFALETVGDASEEILTVSPEEAEDITTSDTDSEDETEPEYPHASDLNLELSVTTNAVTVTWDELPIMGTDSIQYYMVYCYPEGEEYENATKVTYPTTDTVPFTHTFSGLEYDTLYNVGVAAEYQSGYLADYEGCEKTLGDISYIDENGDEQVCSGYTLVESDTIDWSEGCYVVIGEVTVEDSITSTGDINLILTDESKLTVAGEIQIDGNLNIYVQSDSADMGALEVKSLSAGGDGIDVAKTLNISGGTIIVKAEKYGIAAENIIISDGEICSAVNEEASVAIYATDNIEITDGVVETIAGELGYGLYSFCGDIAIGGGNIKIYGGGFGIAGYGKYENDVYQENGNVTISGGFIDIYTTTERGIGIYAEGTLNIYDDEIIRCPISSPCFTGTINSRTNNGSAVYGGIGITIGDMLTISTPEEGTVGSFSDEENKYAIFNSDGNMAENVTIEPVLYRVTIKNLTNATMKIDVPAGRSANVAYKDYCQELYGMDNFFDYLNGYTAKAGYTFDGFYTESGEKFDFEAPVDSDVTITPKWTKISYGGGGSVTTRYTVKFETNGGNTIGKKTVAKNSKLDEPAVPEKDGYSFIGWFTDEELTSAYDFDSKVTKDFTLYAKWEKDADEKPVEVENPFADVNASDWYYEDVIYAALNGLFKGTTETTFAPNDKLTRAMLVTVLYRAEGEPAVWGGLPFVYVEEGSYYEFAVAWAKQVGIVSGVSETEFAP